MPSWKVAWGAFSFFFKDIKCLKFTISPPLSNTCRFVGVYVSVSIIMKTKCWQASTVVFYELVGTWTFVFCFLKKNFFNDTTFGLALNANSNVFLKRNGFLKVF